MTSQPSLSTHPDPRVGGAPPTADLSEHPVFNSLLSQWKREGLRISWPEVEEAYRQALEQEGGRR